MLITLFTNKENKKIKNFIIEIFESRVEPQIFGFSEKCVISCVDFALYASVHSNLNTVLEIKSHRQKEPLGIGNALLCL